MTQITFSVDLKSSSPSFNIVKQDIFNFFVNFSGINAWTLMENISIFQVADIYERVHSGLLGFGGSIDSGECHNSL